MAKPAAGLAFGSWLEILIRVILSLIAAALTFVPTYNKIGQSSQESWVPYFLAFQNGFFCPIRFAPRMLREEATFYTLTKAFGGVKEQFPPSRNNRICVICSHQRFSGSRPPQRSLHAMHE